MAIGFAVFSTLNNRRTSTVSSQLINSYIGVDVIICSTGIQNTEAYILTKFCLVKYNLLTVNIIVVVIYNNRLIVIKCLAVGTDIHFISLNYTSWIISISQESIKSIDIIIVF